MSPLLTIVGWTALASCGAAVAVSGLVEPRPPLERVLRRLERADRPARGIRGALAALPAAAWLVPSEGDLRATSSSREQHLARAGLALLAGFVAPALLVEVLRHLGLVPVGVAAPLIVGVAGAVVAPLIMRMSVTERAERERRDLRHQLSAYLDVVTMLLAGNTGHEGALRQAAEAGDGRLFRTLRRRMRETGAAGDSAVDALSSAADELDLTELRQVAATAALSAAEGTPVARTLASTCATLRSSLAGEQETEARLRTSKLTSPIVGMALIFMALVVYPALATT